MKKLYIIILILVCGLTLYFFYNKVAYLNVVVDFDELDPLDKKMPVYYRGFKIGSSSKIFPDEHYTKTFIKLKISPSDIELPSNVKARIEKNKKMEYINIVYPDEVSLKKLQEGDVIEGQISKDITSIISEQIASGGLENIVSNSSTLLESANTTVIKLGDIFTEVDAMLKDVRKDVKLASSNLAKTTTNLEQMTSNLNSVLDKQTMGNSVENIESVTQNIKEMTESLNEITTQIDKTTMPIINSTLCQTHSTVKNVNEITSGVKNTLKKHMGLGRLLFGKPVSSDN